MKSREQVEQILAEKELQLARVRQEVEALRIVAPLLTDDADVAGKFRAKASRAPDVTSEQIA